MLYRKFPLHEAAGINDHLTENLYTVVNLYC